jgi:basic membrane lipoprotein Med (substrate-binding protein (PBP1-ABC) superfamily)
VILYELVAGQCPFDADSVSDLFAKILHQNPEPASSLRADLPRALDGIIARCLARRPERRYGSVAELARKLAPFAPAHARVSADRAERLIAGDTPPDEPDTIPSYRSDPPTTRRGPARRTMVVAAGAFVAAAIPIGWWALSSRGATAQAPRIGASCTHDDDCGGASCVDKMCTLACSRPADCPEPSRCTSDGRCNVPLRVGFVYVGVPEDEGWTHTHDVGRKYAAAKLPWLDTDYVSNAYRPADAARGVDDLVGRGFEVIVANSSSLGDVMVDKAKQYPSVKFIAVMSYSPGPSVGAINAREYEGWYLAGYAAAQRSRTHRLGYVGAAITPEVVRDINAFTRGARAFDPKAVIEVQWLGFWFDAGKPDADGRYKEERLARQLLASGCDVIANHADNERVVVAVEQAHADAVSIANNNVDACERGPTTCLGVAYWNWGPLYAELLDAIHHHTWNASVERWESLRANPEASVVGFKLNQPVAGSKIALETAMVVADLAKPNGQARVFEGPYCSTGQRTDCVRERESITDDELRSMCWFVDGVIERVDPSDPHSPDRPAMVPRGCAK